MSNDSIDVHPGKQCEILFCGTLARTHWHISIPNAVFCPLDSIETQNTNPSRDRARFEIYYVSPHSYFDRFPVLSQCDDCPMATRLVNPFPWFMLLMWLFVVRVHASLSLSTGTVPHVVIYHSWMCLWLPVCCVDLICFNWNQKFRFLFVQTIVATSSLSLYSISIDSFQWTENKRTLPFKIGILIDDRLASSIHCLPIIIWVPLWSSLISHWSSSSSSYFKPVHNLIPLIISFWCILISFLSFFYYRIN